MATAITLLDKQCQYCKQGITTRFIGCPSCKVVDYCSEEHKAAESIAHHAECKAIRESRTCLEEQAQILRDDPDGNVFASGSMFWSVSETRPYTEACIALIEKLSQLRTVEACRTALRYGFEWLMLNWGVDHRNVRYRIAALMIRLGQDQDAYDFMKWYATTGTDPSYGWLHLYDLEGEDVLEPLYSGDWTDEKKTNLSTMASITLVKLRIWLNLRSLHNASFVAPRLPQEILDYIREDFIATGVVADNQQIMRDIRNGVDIESLYMRPLERQLSDMFRVIERSNAEFWPIIGRRGFLNASEDSDDREWELCIAVSSGREAWEETPGALEWIKEQLRSGH